MTRALLVGGLIVGLAVSMFFQVPAKRAAAMPTFGQSYGVSCDTCHTMVPLLNAYGRYVQRTAYSLLDRDTLKRALPFWIGETVNYNSTASSSGSGTPNYATGNVALHGAGYATPDITFHAQQWITQNNQSGGLDTFWVSYNGLLKRDGHLMVGKLLNPAPSPYGQTSDIDGAAASNTLVGEHNWGATYGNRWGTKFVYAHKNFTAEVGYFLTQDDLNGITDFKPGDKTFQWKVAYAPATQPVEVGLFGSRGSIPVSTGINNYGSIAGYVQLDPGRHGRPGVFLVYQSQLDGSPGADANGNPIPATSSRGASAELFEPIFKGNLLLGLRHDFNDAGIAGGISNGNAVNLSFNVPGTRYVHGYLETALGANSSLSSASGGPTWKGMLWVTLPTRSVR